VKPHPKDRMRMARAAVCPRKVRHEDRASAEAAVARMNGRDGKVMGRDKPRLEAYHCPACGGWHAGRKILVQSRRSA
jgi:hypothetical protein